MTAPRIVRLAAAARAAGAQALKVDERHPGLGGAHLRVWIVDRDAAIRFRTSANVLGFQVPLLAPHLWAADDITYDGWQLCVVVPADDLTGLQTAIGGGRGEIGP